MLELFKKQNKAFTRTPKFGVTPKGGGFTLVETMVAISIFTLSITALMSVLASGVSNTNYAKQKIIAGYLAQEGIEYMRNMRDNYVLYTSVPPFLTWDRFKTDIANTTYPTNDPSYTRTISMILVPGTQDEINISSTVSWKQGSGNPEIKLSEELFNWWK